MGVEAREQRLALLFWSAEAIMPRRPLPWYPTTAAESYEDPELLAMSCEEYGAYCRLRDRAWTQNPHGSIPDNATVLAKWAGITPERWSAIAPAVVSVLVQGRDGRWYFSNLRRAYSRAAATSEARSTAGRKGAEKTNLKRVEPDDQKNPQKNREKAAGPRPGRGKPI